MYTLHLLFAENPGITGGPLLVGDLYSFFSFFKKSCTTVSMLIVLRLYPIVFLQHNGRNSSSGNTRGGVMIRKRRPNWIDAPDDSFFLVTRETR